MEAQQIEESKIRDIRQEDKRPRWDDSSHQKPKKRFFQHEFSMGNKVGLQTKIPKVVAILLRRLCVLLVENNISVGVLPEQIVALVVLIRATT